MTQEVSNPIDAHLKPREGVYQNLPTPIAVLDAKSGMIKFVNQQAITDFGGNAEDIVGKKVSQLLASPLPGNMYTFLSQVLRAEKDLKNKSTREVTFPVIEVALNNKQRRMVEIRPQSIKDGRGKTTGFDLMLVDVTEREQEKALRKAAESLSVAKSTQELVDRIRQILATVIPHDTANFMVVEENDKGDQEVRIVDKWGYENGLQVQLSKSPTVDLTHRPLIQEMLSFKKAVFVAKVASDERYINASGSNKTSDTRSYVGAPVIVAGKVIGFINLNHSTPSFYSEQDAKLLQLFANQIAIGFENAQNATIDSLTGAYNRQFLNDIGPREISRARNGEPLSMVMLDIDRFKMVNDDLGHKAGDSALQDLVKKCKSHLRPADLFCRYGGEEFALLLPETNIGFTLAERLRLSINKTGIDIEGIGNLKKTISLGVAKYSKDFVPSYDDIVRCADEALYVVKENGRNGVGVYIPRHDYVGPDQVAVFRQDEGFISATIFDRPVRDREEPIDRKRQNYIPREKYHLKKEEHKKEDIVSIRTAVYKVVDGNEIRIGHVEVLPSYKHKYRFHPSDDFDQIRQREEGNSETMNWLDALFGEFAGEGEIDIAPDT